MFPTGNALGHVIPRQQYDKNYVVDEARAQQVNVIRSVPSLVSEAEKLFEELAGSVNGLEDYLASVLQPPAPEGNGDARATQPVFSPLGCSVSMLNDRIRYLTDRVRRISARLEL